MVVAVLLCLMMRVWAGRGEGTTRETILTREPILTARGLAIALLGGRGCARRGRRSGHGAAAATDGGGALANPALAPTHADLRCSASSDL
eukprot:COSAG01_NODE_5550_length_4190_cov_48.559276_2_plen_90_part_00